MDFFLGLLIFLAGGITVIALKVNRVSSFFDQIRDFFEMLGP